MGRHAMKKYGNPYGQEGYTGSRMDKRRARKYGSINPYAIGGLRTGGFAKFVPLIALGALAVGTLTLLKKWKLKRMFSAGWFSSIPFFSRWSSTGLSTTGLASTSIASTSVSAPVLSGRGRLIARQRIPGERIKEVDMITRKRVPYHEEVEVFEGPASFETYQGGEREYMDAGVESFGTTASGIEGGETITAPAHSHGAPIVSNRRVPIRDRVKSKVLRRPVVTKYY